MNTFILISLILFVLLIVLAFVDDKYKWSDKRRWVGHIFSVCMLSLQY